MSKVFICRFDNPDSTRGPLRIFQTTAKPFRLPHRNKKIVNNDRQPQAVVTAVAGTATVTGANLAYAAVAYIVKQTVVDTWGE